MTSSLFGKMFLNDEELVTLLEKNKENLEYQ